ncbi:hypothetical protein TNCV_2938981 [Trichonephila clavipes]|nr:hypothetical protein TNCV_2938981 [Trichonephila clavipes]
MNLFTADVKLSDLLPSATTFHDEDDWIEFITVYDNKEVNTGEVEEPGRPFSDESRFNLSSDGNRVHVWRPRGERLSTVFALQRHITPTAGVMV